MTDVASHAGVSMKTVSNVINELPCVAEETRQKVVEAIAAVGYRHNRMARSLATGKTNSVGIVIPDVANPFFGAAVRACEDVLYGDGYSIFLCNTSEDIERERDYLEQLLSRGVDGLILWGTRICCADLEALIGPAVPLITIELDERPSGARHTAINVDDAGGAEWVIAHLAAEGRRSIAHLAGPLTRITPQRRRMGYLAGLAAAGFTANPEWLIEEEPSVAGGFRSATAALAGPARPDALFCYNDLMAVGALLAARKLGARVPEDVAVAGFDDIDIASIVDPPLTTVRIAQRELGRLAGESLLARLMGKTDGPESVVFPVELVTRGSTSRGRLTEAERQATLEQLLTAIMNGQPAAQTGAAPEATR
jgi:LacI family transcriptional regulator